MFAASQSATLLDARKLARLVVLPEPVEAPQLALEVAGRLAVALEPAGSPVDLVHLGERVDEVDARCAAAPRGVSRASGISLVTTSRRSTP